METHDRITSREIADLLDDLRCGDQDAQEGALRALCPCRNRRYDREAWRAIFLVHKASETESVRDAAAHAIQTLHGRARRDPRSQDLLRWLESEGVCDPRPESLLPVWRPRLHWAQGQLAIPRRERLRRSKANRRR